MIRNSGITQHARDNRKNRKAFKMRVKATEVWIKDRQETAEAVRQMLEVRKDLPVGHPDRLFTPLEWEISRKYLNQCKA
jgi:hypothetical protein